MKRGSCSVYHVCSLVLFCFLFALVCAVTKMGAKGWSMEHGAWQRLEHAGTRFSGFRVDKKTRFKGLVSLDFNCVFGHKCSFLERHS